MNDYDLKLNEQKVKDESVIWLDYIKVQNEALKERLELKYNDLDLSSPIVKIYYTRHMTKH